MQYLFGPAADELEADDLGAESQRMALIAEHLQPAPGADRDMSMAVRTVLVNQILDDDPPHVWRTVERLRDAGHGREDVISQMTMVLAEHLHQAMNEGEEPDPDRYLATLDDLPVPDTTVIVTELVNAARRQPGIALDGLIDEVVREHSPSGSSVVTTLVERVLDYASAGPLCLLADDSAYVVADLVDGLTFTRRYNESEAELELLSVGFDLGALNQFDVVRLPDGTELDMFSVEYGHLAWRGPEGWLSAFSPGDLLATTVHVDEAPGGAHEALAAEVTIERVGDEPTISDDLIAAVRASYDECVAEPWLPVTGEEIGLWLCARRPDLLDGTPPPLSEVCAAAGLEQRGGLVAHDDTVWRNDLLGRRFKAVGAAVADRDDRLLLGRALESLDDPEAPVDEVRRSLAECADSQLVHVLADVLFPHYLESADEFELDGVDAPGHLFRLVDRALSVARRRSEQAAAEYLAAILWERCAEPERAEEHLTRSVNSGTRVGAALERLGWYRFDRGDARGAMRWWRELEELPPAAGTIAPFLEPAGERKLGRNEPCWCGSGRKFKQCHQNSVELPPLPDRVGWLACKASTWIDHAHGDVRDAVFTLAAVRATGDPDVDVADLFDELPEDDLASMFHDAFDDPIVRDAALHESGLFGLFLRERGALLPDDEQLLAASWQTAERSVHEVVSVESDSTMTLRDLATGDVVEVRERTLSRSAREGELYCARVLPDGAAHQIVGGVFPVRTGHEQAVLDLCAEGDEMELCAWVGRLRQPPTIERTPGLIDSMFDFEQLRSVVELLGDDADEAAIEAAMNRELGRQAQGRWLDEQVPALEGLTPREAFADPTRREQLERLLDEFDRIDERSRSAGDGLGVVMYDVAELRRELGLD